MKKVTVPAAGKHTEISATGLSVLIVDAPALNSLDDVPLISFDQPGENLPVQRGNRFPYAECGFRNLVLTGTAASAGKDVYLAPLNICVQPFINPDPGQTKKSLCGTSFPKNATDVAQSFTDLELQNSSGILPVELSIQARDNPVSIAFDTDPDQASFGKILTPPDPTAAPPEPAEIYTVRGIDFIRKFRWIAANNTAAGKIIVTPRY